VFEDINGDGKPSANEPGVKGVVLVLEDGSKVTTDTSGRYAFSKASVGEHTLTLDLKTLPTKYLPTVPIFKDINLFEGISYVYNIPLKKEK
jgi:hypothetical protein